MGNAQFSGEPPLAAPDLRIWFDGRRFHYQQYRYDRLADAMAYAMIDQRRPDFQPLPLPLTWEKWTEPTSEETKLMTTVGIIYENGSYRYNEFRYDQLEHALAYAYQNQDRPQSNRQPIWWPVFKRQRRANVTTANAVARGLNILSVRNANLARRYMEHKQVPNLVIARVLAEPTLRRRESAEQSHSEAIKPSKQ